MDDYAFIISLRIKLLLLN